jgi:hypothetical protein
MDAMSNQPDPYDIEVSANADVFYAQLPELMQTEAGRFALMRQQKIVEFFDTFGDACRCGDLLYQDEPFSVQEVTTQPIYLGRFAT